MDLNIDELLRIYVVMCKASDDKLVSQEFADLVEKIRKELTSGN